MPWKTCLQKFLTWSDILIAWWFFRLMVCLVFIFIFWIRSDDSKETIILVSSLFHQFSELLFDSKFLWLGYLDLSWGEKMIELWTSLHVFPCLETSQVFLTLAIQSMSSMVYRHFFSGMECVHHRKMNLESKLALKIEPSFKKKMTQNLRKDISLENLML